MDMEKEMRYFVGSNDFQSDGFIIVKRTGLRVQPRTANKHRKLTLFVMFLV